MARGSILFIPLLAPAALVAALLAVVAFRMALVLGFGGSPLPDMLSHLEPLLPPSQLRPVVELTTPPGNLAVARDGRVIFNFHPEYSEPSGAKIAECQPDASGSCGTKWTTHPATNRVKTVLSLRIDRQDRLWLLDFADHATISAPALLAYQLGRDGASDTFLYRHEFSKDVAPFGAMLNDFQVSPNGEDIYIADTAIVGSIAGSCAPALLWHHIPSNTTRRLLAGHYSMRAQPGVSMAVHGHDRVYPQALGPFSMAIGVDSIVLDRSGEWLYYGPVTGSVLFRIKTSALRGNTLPATADGLPIALVEEYAPKPVSDGLTIDDDGNVYVSAFEQSAVAMIRASDRRLVLVVQDRRRLQWPDGFSFGEGKWLYVTTSALHLKFGGESLSEHAPFYVMRMSVPQGGASGH